MSSWLRLPSIGTKADDDASESSDDIRRGVGPAFTAMKCPNGPGLENSAEIPFGFVWTPIAATGDDPSEDGSDEMPIIKCGSNSMPPVLCLACLAYINPFAEIDRQTGIWICPLCGHQNVLSKKDLCQGSKVMTALNSPCVEYHQVVSKPKPSEEEKKDDGRYNYTIKDDEDEEDYCTYLLVVDENLSPGDGQAIAPAMEAILKERASSGNPDAYPKARIALVVFGKSVSIYQVGISGLASADIYAGPEDFAGDDDKFDKDMEKRSYVADVQSGDLTSLRNALSSIFGITVEDASISTSSGFFSSSSSRMAMLSRKKAARLRQEENGTDNENGIAAKSPWMQSRQESSSVNQKRCTGNAVQCALDVASASTNSSRTSRILLFTNGFPNSGDGSVVGPEDSFENTNIKMGKRATHSIVDTDMLQKAVEHFDALASAAIDVGIGLDVFCCGVTELGLPAYQAMVEPSGGYVVPLLTLDTPQLNQNLKFILNDTYMSRSRYIPKDLTTSGAECIIDIRSDSFVTPSQLCGSGTVLTQRTSGLIENETSAYEEGSRLALEKGFKVRNLPSERALELSMTRIQLGRVDPLNTMSVLLEVDDSIGEKDEYAFFQVVSRSISPRGDVEITRVCSVRLEMAKDVNDFLGSVDDEVMSVVLAKVAVYRSLYGREETDYTRDLTAAGDANTQEKLAYDTQLDLDATVQRISGAFRLLDLQKNTKRRT